MSVPATEMGSVGSASPTSVNTPTTSLSAPPLTALAGAGGLLGPLLSKLTGTGGTGSSPALGNYALIAIGAVLIVGALLISQKQTVITAARVAA